MNFEEELEVLNNEGLNHSEIKGFWDHLEELRGVLLKSMAVFLAACVFVGVFFSFFANLLNAPLAKAMSDNTSVMQGLVTTSPMGIFSVLIQVCFLGGLGISFPFMIYFFAKFLSPALKEREKNILLPSCFAVLILFLIGAGFSYFMVLPASLVFSIHLNQLFGFQLIWSAPQYYGLVVWMTLGIGLCFEFPLIILLLVKIGIVSAVKLKRIRRHMIVAVLIVSSLITPGGDPFSLLILAIPLYILYEISILISVRIDHARAIEE